MDPAIYKQLFGSSDTNKLVTVWNVGFHGESDSLRVAMSQLNIITITGNKTTKNCEPYKSQLVPKKFKPSLGLPLYLSMADVLSRIELIQQRHPNSKYIVSVVDEKKWFHEQFLFACNHAESDVQSEHCKLPIAHGYEVTSDSRDRLSKDLKQTTLSTVTALFKAYYSLLRCLIPERQLHFALMNESLSRTSTPSGTASSQFWNGLVSFLDLNISSRTLNSLSKAGIPSVSNDVMMIGEYPRLAFRRKGFSNLTIPSVCSIQHNLDTVQVVNPRMVSCAGNYADDLDAVVGSQFREVVLQKLLRPVYAVQFDSEAQIVLNIGPGSTGTRSLFMAARQLNITSRHYTMYSSNCGMSSEKFHFKEFGDDLQPLQLKETKRVFWGDIPVSERWWHLLAQYPSQIKFIMTDVDSDKWLRSRLLEHCSNNFKRYNGCTPPTPFSFHMHNKHFTKTQNVLLDALFNQTHLQHISPAVNAGMWDAYRKLIRCVVPKPQLHWP